MTALLVKGTFTGWCVLCKMDHDKENKLVAFDLYEVETASYASRVTISKINFDDCWRKIDVEWSTDDWNYFERLPRRIVQFGILGRITPIDTALTKAQRAGGYYYPFAARTDPRVAVAHTISYHVTAFELFVLKQEAPEYIQYKLLS